MKKSLIYFVSLICICCLVLGLMFIFRKDDKQKNEPSKNESNFNLGDPIKNKIDIGVSKLLNSNYDYKYIVKSENDNLVYTGTFFDNIINGVYNSNIDGVNQIINFQIENNTCYDVSTGEEIFNVFYETNKNYLLLESILVNIKDASCQIDGDVINCISNKTKYEFLFDKEFIISINIEASEEHYSKYNLVFNNFNSTKVIKKINKYVFLSFNSDPEEIKTLHEADGIYEYGIKNSVLIFQNNVESIDIQKILPYAHYTKTYNNIIKYIFEDDYVIFIKNEKDIQQVILTKNEYTNEVLKIMNNL